MPIIRTTMQPDVDLEVSDAELLDLTRQGLVAETRPTPPAAAPAKTTTAAKGKES